MEHDLSPEEIHPQGESSSTESVADEEKGETSPQEIPSPSPEEDDQQDQTQDQQWQLLRHEVAQARQETESLKEQLRQSLQFSSQISQSALEQYKTRATLLMDKARLAKKQALERQDIDGIMAADEEMIQASTQLHWAHMLPLVSASEKKQDRRQEPEQSPLHPATARWIHAYPWMDPSSSSFDPDKMSPVVSYATALEHQLEQQGRRHEINSPGYFRKLEAYAHYEDGQNTIKMSPLSSPVFPVKGSSQRSTKVEKVRPLTQQEKNLCAIMEISESEYLKNRELDRQKQKRR